MDTYGDMMTLLLCFFVLLYSMSTMDEQKWEQLVESFNPEALAAFEDPTPMPSDSEEEEEITMQEVETALDELYESLQNYVKENDMEGRIKVTKGDGYVYLTFENTVFFSGDSSALRKAGKRILLDIVPALNHARKAIDELRILGHTAQADPNKANDPEWDRVLSGERAAMVGAYLQNHSKLNGARIVTMGYGQWRPIASNDTEKGRSQNRRVEMIITGKNLEKELSDSLKSYETMVKK